MFGSSDVVVTAPLPIVTYHEIFVKSLNYEFKRLFLFKNSVRKLTKQKVWYILSIYKTERIDFMTYHNTEMGKQSGYSHTKVHTGAN